MAGKEMAYWRNFSRHGELAMALREILIVIAVALLLLAVVVPMLSRGKLEAKRSYCVRRLEHIGRAFNNWSMEHGHHYPMEMDFDDQGRSVFANETNPCTYFQIMSNELQRASVLACPADRERHYATNFTTDFKRERISYFIGLDADPSLPKAFLAGDRNLANGARLKNGILELTTDQTVAWSRDMHDHVGNVVLVDGSVSGLDARQLKNALAATGLTTNRLLMP